MSIPQKYHLDPEDHVFGGDDTWFNLDDLDTIRTKMALCMGVVVGIESYELPKSDPGFTGVDHPDGLAVFVVIVRMIENVGLSEKYTIGRFWATITCVGRRELQRALSMSRPHPEENKA